MKEIIIRTIVGALLLLGTGYTTKTIFKTVEKITVTRIQKGFTSFEEMTEKLAGKKFDHKKLFKQEAL